MFVLLAGCFNVFNAANILGVSVKNNSGSSKAAPAARALERRLGLGAATAFVVGEVIGVGIFLTPVFFYVMMRLTERHKTPVEPIVTAVDEK